MKVKIYKYLSDSFELIECEEGKTLADSLPEIKDWRKRKVFVNGKIEDEKHIVDYADNIFIRSIPYEGYSASDWFYTIITGGIYAVVKSGKEAYEANKEMQKALKELEKLKGTTKDDILNLPYLKGSSNSLATGKTQPYIIGTHLFTPYILNAAKSGSASNGYHEISGANGTTQFLNRVYELGFSKQILQKISIGDIDLIEFGKSEVFDGVYYFDNKAYTSDDSFCEIAQNARFTKDIFNKKIVEVEKSDSLKMADDDDYEDLIYTLESNSMEADICIMFNGLMMYTSSGVKGSRTRNIIPSYSYDYAELAKSGNESQATWHDFTFTKAKWIDAVTTEDSGVYQWIKYYSGKPTDYEVKAAKDSWTFQSGTDIKDSFTSFECSKKAYRYNSKGKITSWIVTIYLKKKTTVPGHYGDNVETTQFSGQFSSQIRYNAHIDFSFDEVFEEKTNDDGTTYYVEKHSQPISLKISTPDKALTEGQDVSDCYVQWIHSYTYDKTKTKAQGKFVEEKIIEDEPLNVSCMLGVHLEATTANEELTDSLQVVTSGVARIFEKDDDGNYSLSSTKKLTSNPAAWWCEVLTSDCHNPSKYDDEEIDLQSFGKWYDFCEDKGFTVDYVITNGKTKSSILELIRECGRASTYTNIYGKIAVAYDDEIENASGLLNEQNLVSFSYEKEMTRKVDGVSVKYIDADNGYQENNIVIMYDGSVNPEERDPDATLKSLSFDGITTWQNAYRKALYTMKCDRLRPKKCIASVGEEGFFFTPFSKFLIQHPSLKIGLGNSEIKNVIYNDDETEITGLELYDAVELDETHDFNVVIQCVSDDYCTPISASIEGYNGRTTEIEFKEPISTIRFVKPHKNDILSYGYEVATVTDEMIVSNVEKSDSGYKLTLYDYDSRIFEEVAEFPDYEPNLTEPKNNSSALPSSLPSPTIAEVNSTIEKAVESIDMSIVESPNIYAEVTACGFSVNDDGITPIAQSIKTTVHVIQENKEIDFFFDEFELPEGFSVDIDYHTLTFTVESGLRIGTGNINIPVIFRKLLHDNFYGDEDGTIYQDESGEVYGEYGFDTKLTYYNLGFSYEGVKGGKYLGKIETVEDIPSENIVIGDYFTWAGDDTESYKKSACYAWDGLKWTSDSVRNHLGGTLSDVLSIANNNLEANNSEAYQFLDHLTANSIFVDKLVANTAFIESLFAKQITLEDEGYIQSSNFSAGTSGFQIKADGTATFRNGTFSNAEVSGKVTATSGSFSNVTVSNLSVANGAKFLNHYMAFSNVGYTNFLSRVSLNYTYNFVYGYIIIQDGTSGSWEFRPTTIAMGIDGANKIFDATGIYNGMYEGEFFVNQDGAMLIYEKIGKTETVTIDMTKYTFKVYLEF